MYLSGSVIINGVSRDLSENKNNVSKVPCLFIRKYRSIFCLLFIQKAGLLKAAKVVDLDKNLPM